MLYVVVWGCKVLVWEDNQYNKIMLYAHSSHSLSSHCREHTFLYLYTVFAVSLSTAYCLSKRAAYIARTSYIPLHLSMHYARCFVFVFFYQRIRRAVRIALLLALSKDGGLESSLPTL